MKVLNKIILGFLLLLLLVSCGDSQKEEISSLPNEPEPAVVASNKSKIVQPKLEENSFLSVAEVVAICRGLCDSKDAETYCTVQQAVVFDTGKKTLGTCRSLGKRSESFGRCETLCTKYGHETDTIKGCRYPDGGIDSKCIGK